METVKIYSNVKGNEARILHWSIVLFWSLFWFFNVMDKFIGGPTFLWFGEDRFAQFVKYFTSIGIEHPNVAWGFLVFTTILEVIAFLLLTPPLWCLIQGKDEKAHSFYFLGTLVGLAAFTFFGVGDQVFGDRREL